MDKPTRPPYTYSARLSRVIDGDSYVLDIDTGFNVHVFATVRLLGWNCAELAAEDGPRVKGVAEELLVAAKQILVTTSKDTQSFARWVAAIWIDGEELGQKLAERGLATRR